MQLNEDSEEDHIDIRKELMSNQRTRAMKMQEILEIDTQRTTSTQYNNDLIPSQRKVIIKSKGYAYGY